MKMGIMNHDAEIFRAKTDSLIRTRELTESQLKNTELNKTEMKDGAVYLKSRPQRLVFEMTNVCNLNCVMCGRNSAEFKPVYFDKSRLSLFDDIAHQIEEVTLMGWGEPTMHPNFVEFLEWASKHDLRKYFCTNGMKLGELTRHIFDHDVDVIAVSVDAANAVLNEEIRRGVDFDKVINNIKNILAKKKRLDKKWPYMNFVTTLMKKNLLEFPKIVRLAADIGLEEVKCVYLTAFDERTKDEILYDCMDEVRIVFDEALKIANKTGVKIKLPHIRGEDTAGDEYHKPCHAPWRDFFVGSDGYIRPCMSTPIRFLSIQEHETFDEIWNDDAFMKFRQNVNERDNMPDSCKNCYQSSHANWNRETAFDQTGKNFSPAWGYK